MGLDYLFVPSTTAAFCFEYRPVRSHTSAPQFSLTKLYEIIETIRLLWNLGENERLNVFWWRGEILELCWSGKNDPSLEGVARYEKYSCYEKPNVKVSSLIPQSGLKILQNDDGAKDDTEIVSVWIFESEEEPSVDASLLEKSNDSGIYGNGTGTAFLRVSIALKLQDGETP